MNQSAYPIALDLSGKRCLVAGGGEIAEGKLDALLRAGARVTIVSPEVRPRIADLAGADRLTLYRRAYRPADLRGVFLVIAATDDRAVNATVAAQARQAGILVNAVDDPPNCDFYAVSVVRRGDLQVAISTGGRSPAFARWMREHLDAALPATYADLLDILGDVRLVLRERGPIPFYEEWDAAISPEVLDALQRGDLGDARDRITRSLMAAQDRALASEAPEAIALVPRRVKPGRVSIVGAGPGDPELITVKGLDRLRGADVVLYDRLVHPRQLDEAPVGAERIFVGKAAGISSWSQRAIEATLIEKARAGKQVVRLKGGDPFVFGRGGEEVAALAAAGVPVEMIPGVTAATAVPAGAGIPVTHRDLASALTVVTAHEDPAKPESAVDWDWLARAPGTVVVLMGLRQVDAVCARLIAAGRDPSTPAAVVASGTLPEQRVVRANLATLPAAVVAAELNTPALIVIGDVVRFAEQLHDAQDPPPVAVRCAG